MTRQHLQQPNPLQAAILLGFSALLALLPVLGYTQTGNLEERLERLETAKIGFLTRQLDLSPEEAQQFWPVYNEFQEEIKSIRLERRKLQREGRTGFDNLSEQEIEALTDQFVQLEVEEAEVKQRYHNRFKAVLPPSKVARLYRAEMKFKQEILERLRERRQGRGGFRNDGPPQRRRWD